MPKNGAFLGANIKRRKNIGNWCLIFAIFVQIDWKTILDSFYAKHSLNNRKLTLIYKLRKMEIQLYKQTLSRLDLKQLRQLMPLRNLAFGNIT